MYFKKIIVFCRAKHKEGNCHKRYFEKFSLRFANSLTYLRSIFIELFLIKYLLNMRLKIF